MDMDEVIDMMQGYGHGHGHGVVMDLSIEHGHMDNMVVPQKIKSKGVTLLLRKTSYFL
jgi:hypothetical protein